MANGNPTIAQKIATKTSDLHSHFNDVLFELKQALAGSGARLPIKDDDKAVDTLGNAVAVATVVNDTFFPNLKQGVQPEDLVNDTVKQLALRIVLIQAKKL